MRWASRRTAVALVLAIALATLAARPLAAGDDPHENYYYPKPQTVETYTARVATLRASDKVRRIGFVTGLTQQLLSAHYAPSYAIFAKGDDAEKLIIVGLREGELNTLYRARAVLAMLTAVSRLTPFFRENTIAEESTFLDLLKLLGFKQVTITDGERFAHQVVID